MRTSEIKILSNLPKHPFTVHKKRFVKASCPEWGCWHAVALELSSHRHCFTLCSRYWKRQTSKTQNCKIFCPRTSLLSKPTKCSRSQRTMWQPNTLENITRATCNNPHIHESKTTSFLSKARQGIPLVCAFIHRGRQTFLLHFLLVDRSRLATGESQFERKFLGLQKFPAWFLAKSMWHERVWVSLAD